MARYYRTVTDQTILSRIAGHNRVIPTDFQQLSSKLIAECSFSQSLIQSVIYTTHGAELRKAKKALKEFPSPKARFDFLCTFPLNNPDPVVSKVFEYARGIFRDIYDLRNVLAHEVWASSEAFPGQVLFTSLDSEAQLLLDSGKIWHTEVMTPEDIFNGTVRYIRSVKLMTSEHLRLAVGHAEFCSWMLMQIGIILNEPDAARREEARRGFKVFRGTAHLFGGPLNKQEPVDFRASKKKAVRGERKPQV